jgi:hypothetical protein
LGHVSLSFLHKRKKTCLSKTFFKVKAWGEKVAAKKLLFQGQT